MRVLIVEDDAALGPFLSNGLRREGHEVFLETNGRAGLEHALALAPDLMVLDLSLPQLDGVEVLEQMQGKFGDTSVLVLTGRNGVEDRVKCLNLGADDCLLKPFSYNELIARCRALLRRREQFSDPILRAGDVELNRMEHRVSREGIPLDLTTKEFALLEYLMQARGRVCTREELLRELWQTSPVAGTNVVDVYINYLRKKLASAHMVAHGSAEASEAVIGTVRGKGYRIAAPDRDQDRSPGSVMQAGRGAHSPHAWGRVVQVSA
jgi:DNA-binding response OmpR family regulator